MVTYFQISLALNNGAARNSNTFENTNCVGKNILLFSFCGSVYVTKIEANELNGVCLM